MKPELETIAGLEYTGILNAGQLIYWINLAPGEFCVNHISHNLEDQILYTEQLETLVNLNMLERVGKRRGWYRKPQTGLIEMDFVNADDIPVDVWLPFDCSDLVELYPGSVIIVSGSPNSGKTALMLNIIKENRHKGWDIHYFNSEMAPGELRKRLSKFPDITLDQWQFKAYRRSDNFTDVIQPGVNSLNIIDFLEVYDEFYKIGAQIKAIHDKLDGGLAFVCLQKNPGSDTGLGGYRTMEVTRLALAVDHGTVKIIKAKNFRTEKNPNGLMKDFKLIDGCQIVDKHGWYRKQTGDE